MPRENRKRGKKHKPQKQEEQQQQPEPEPEYYEDLTGAQEGEAQPDDRAPDTPFGFVDPDVKAYFRTVDAQLKEWQDDYDRRNFLVAALSEMSGKELQLATDPDCAGIVERMMHSMDNFLKRVFVDRLSGSFEQLVSHRFGSHVCQTIFTMAGGTIAREARGVLPSHPDAQSGSLRTLTKLVLNACQELLPNCSTLLTHPFASHVLRALIALLCPAVASESEKDLRSKKSAAYKAKQGPMKSIFVDEQAQARDDAALRPPECDAMARRILHAIKKDLSANETRAVAADKVGSPTLKLFVELEVHLEESDMEDSIMDHLLVGLVTASHASDGSQPEPSDYLTTLLYDTTASHLLESLVSRSPPAVFSLLWRVYFAGKLQKLAVHPVANFVVARAVDRLSADELRDALEEMDGVCAKMRKTARLGVLKVLVDRAAALHASEDVVVDAVCKAFDIESDEDRKVAVSSILRLKTPSEYRDARKAAAGGEGADERPSKRRRQDTDPLEPRIQGALLLQSLLHLAEAHQALVVDRPVQPFLLAMAPEELLELAHHPMSSRVLDAAFSSPAVQPRMRKKLVALFLGRFHQLADDRIGSRVAERAWAAADTYLKEKVARSLMPHEAFLTGSHYGRFFARAVNLPLLVRRPDDWRAAQTQKAAPPPAPPAPAPAPATAERKEKKKRKHHEDEIDELFAAGAKKRKQADADGAGAEVKKMNAKEKRTGAPTVLAENIDDSVLHAIRAAPGESSRKRHI
ncbi:ARM repeat-containing protein [Auricularia subglabra TFB-10046 SS5]|nr:ARM repeat-containing protein [Auricularia subglabra TFB-10046 SS5]